MMIAAMIALALAGQDVPPVPPGHEFPDWMEQQQPSGLPPVAAPQQAAPTDKHARRDLRRRLERAGELYETLGRCTGSLSVEEVQALLADARGAGVAGEYLTGRFEAGLRRTRDDDGWCRREVDKAAARLVQP